ncbi:MAG: DUF3307 domain-containing protein [Anaerolineales bacterium]|nr:MAG: DUF3307 domain-containing protein [Anaerolineales bacterium]
MIWIILLAHFLADYPLQFPWILRNKHRAHAVAVHAGIHLLVLLLLVGAERARIWPYLVVLTVIHFFIDLGKNLVYKLRPNWVVVPYIVDQCIHYVVIFGTAAWMQAVLGDISLPFDPRWAVLATGYLVVMYVWFISERIIVYGTPSYQAEVQAQAWSRMLTRGGLLTILLAINGISTSAAVAAITTATLPYVEGKYRWRAFVTDIMVVCTTWLFTLLAT